MRVAEIDKRREFSVGALEIEDLMDIKGEVENECGFNVKVSIKDLIEKIGSVERSFGESDVFSFVDGLDFESTQNESS